MTGTITVDVVEELSLSVFAVTGDVLVDEVVRVIRKHFPEHRSDNSLWDLSDADLSVLAKDGIVRIAEAGRTVERHRRADGRTAIVVKRDVERLLLNIYKAVNEMQGSPRAFRFFDNRDDAIAWIREGAGASR